MASRSGSTVSVKAKVLIVDEHPAVREDLAMLLATQPDLEVCGEAADLHGALALVARARPDVAIVDISLRNGNGIEVIRRISRRHGAVRILVWSMYPENVYARRALRAGAHGYLNKGQATRHVLDAVRAILQGKLYVSREVVNQLLPAVDGRKPAEHSPLDRLSNRELEAFQYMGQGMSTEAIADKMDISPRTLETFRSRMKQKLEISTLAELLERAAQWVAGSKFLSD
jgi:DNA-binding NarL/FixJ family response regulator